ncbi:hypothetical protein CNMCM6805_002010 [Aspergillus fumigatiaffinis]|uniref:Uncharacterized protein n=1 Tax=Aspergillus fumigatiaffinis TaxID=340414 RepID=A0A8H4GUK1_9EURO|nr:hypothetical protein CNMCM6805_002010 [Aspergillus fumigatiaffinis]
MTYLSNLQGPLLRKQHRTSTVEAVEARVVLDLLPVPPPGITLATVVKAAWALVLGELTGKTDLVFCQTVNGRSGMVTRHAQEHHLQITVFDYLDLSGTVKKTPELDHQFHISFKSIENDKAVPYLQRETRSETWVFLDSSPIASGPSDPEWHVWHGFEYGQSLGGEDGSRGSGPTRHAGYISGAADAT